MRLFVAINLPAPVRAAIAGAIASVQQVVEGVRWTEPEALHITVKFLGDVSESLLEAVANVVRSCAAAHAPVTIEIGGVGAFPNVLRPRIFWVGVKDSGALGAITRELDVALVRLGFEPEARPFTPHVTIGRLRGRRGASPARRNGDLPAGTLRQSVRVETIDLMRSHTGRGGVHYECLLAARLGEGGD